MILTNGRIKPDDNKSKNPKIHKVSFSYCWSTQSHFLLSQIIRADDLDEHQIPTCQKEREYKRNTKLASEYCTNVPRYLGMAAWAPLVVTGVQRQQRPCTGFQKVKLTIILLTINVSKLYLFARLRVNRHSISIMTTLTNIRWPLMTLLILKWRYSY